MKYTYAQNNPQMYNDPSGHFIATVQMCINSAFNSYVRNYHALNVIGMISGVMNATVNQLLGGGDDLMGAYIKGYIAGVVGGSVYYGACAITAVFEVEALVHMGMFFLLSGISLSELTLALCAGAVGNNKAALVHTVLAVLSIGGAIWELGLSGVISVTGPKGTVEIDISGKADKRGTVTNKIPDNNSTTGHIFRDAEGHIPDTPENRILLETVANNTENFCGTDKYGNEWYMKVLENGKQVWVESRDGNIFEGGINEIPKPWNSNTGLKKQ